MDGTFLPRILSKKPRVSASTQHIPRPKPPPSASGSAYPAPIPGSNASDGSPKHFNYIKGKKSQEGYLSDLDMLSLLELSLSDYALWLDAGLRHSVELERDGFIPLMYITNESPYFQQTLSQPQGKHPAQLPPQSSIIRAIRNSPLNEVVDVRMLISEPLPWTPSSSSSRNWSQSGHGGFEIRRKDWGDVQQALRNVSKDKWDAQTVYVENLPLNTRTIPRIHHFISKLLDRNLSSKSVDPSNDTDVSSVLPLFSIQHIATFVDLHHPNAQGYARRDKCYGYAFVTFKEMRLSEALLKEWPWNFEEARSKSREGAGTSEEEALRYSFRAISRSQWTKLKDEYLEHQKHMGEMSVPESRQSLQTPPVSGPRLPSKAKFIAKTTVSDVTSPKGIQASAPPPTYPIGCLVFVKNVHPETNKTALRELFSAVFKNGNTDRKFSQIDYVDYTKGLDACYLRLSHPMHSSLVRSYFTSRRIRQSSGSDTAGAELDADAPSSQKPIQVEIVSDRKEQMYWEKVPERVKMEAVKKLVTVEAPDVEAANDRGYSRRREHV